MSQAPLSATLDFNGLAQYSGRLVERLAKRVKALEIPGCDRRNLSRYHEFIKSYPQILATLSPKFAPLLDLAPLMARMAATAARFRSGQVAADDGGPLPCH